MANSYLKDPEDEMDYAFNFADWLADGETITTETVTAEDGLTIDSYSESSGKVTYWTSGGTAGTNYYVDCVIETSASRKKSRRMLIKVLDQ